MSALRTAAQQALEALEDARTFTGAWPTGSKAITNLRAALAQQAEPVKPVAWMRPDNRVAEESYSRTQFSRGRDKPPIGTWTPLYTAPPQRKPLTKEQFLYIYNQLPNWGMDMDSLPQGLEKFGRAVERAHGIGEQP